MYAHISKSVIETDALNKGKHSTAQFSESSIYFARLILNYWLLSGRRVKSRQKFDYFSAFSGQSQKVKTIFFNSEKFILKISSLFCFVPLSARASACASMLYRAKEFKP